MPKPKADPNTEAVLMALDQLSQTMEAMRQVVSRLKRRVEAAETSPANADSAAPVLERDEAELKHPDTRVLH